MLLTQAYALFAAASCAASAAASNPVFLPLDYPFGNYPKISTNILYGTPPQKRPIKTVVDLGSANFWVYGPKAILNYGSTALGGVGPCNQSISPFYDYPASSTSTKPVKNERVYVYGGNSKFVSAYRAVNDTINFKNAPSIKNQRVEVSNFTTLRQSSPECSGAGIYDHSILGISPYVKGDPPAGTIGPSFRQNLLNQGMIESSTLSMWFDKPPANATGTYAFRGTALFGAIPKGKYSGDLVSVKPNPPKGTFVGYYVSTPSVEANSINNLDESGPVRVLKGQRRCLIDSGAGQDYLPINQKSFLKTTGLTTYEGTPAFKGSCDDIPANATVSYTFAGLNDDNVTVKVPLRNYARDTQFGKGFCTLSMTLGFGGSCIFGAPFVSGAFLAFNDEKNQIAIAQGLVSSGATGGVEGLGPVTVIKKGQGLP